DTGEIYNPVNDTWTAESNSMSAKRAAFGTEPVLETFPTFDLLMAGGIDFEGGTFPTTCAASAALTQTTTASADLFVPASTTTGAFQATGSLNQARGGQGFGFEAVVQSSGA